MANPSIDELIRLVSDLMLPFYDVQRDAVLPLRERRFENDAEHSWSVPFLACSLARQVDPSLDVGKVAQFGLVHDLVEVHAGDTTPWGEQPEIDAKEHKEAAALTKIELDFATFPWIAETIKSYERKDTSEARFVWALDKVIILILRHLDKGRFYIEHGITKDFFDERNVAHRRKAHAHAQAAGYYEQLRTLFDEHPEYFASPGRPV